MSARLVLVGSKKKDAPAQESPDPSSNAGTATTATPQQQAACYRCSEKEELVSESRRAIEMLNDRVKRLKSTIIEMHDQIKTRDDQIASQQDTLQDMTDSLRERHNTVETLHGEVQRRTLEIQQLNTQLEDRDRSLIEVENLLRETTSDLATAQKDLEKLRSENRAIEQRMQKSLKEERLSHRADTQKLAKQVETARTSEEDRLNAMISERNQLKRKNESLTRDLNALLKLVKKYEKKAPLQPSDGSGHLADVRRGSQPRAQSARMADHRSGSVASTKSKGSMDSTSSSDDGQSAQQLRAFYDGNGNASTSTAAVRASGRSASYVSDVSSASAGPGIAVDPARRYTLESRIYAPAQPAALAATAVSEEPTDGKSTAMQHLANELSETIMEKEQIIESLRKMNTFLGKRVLELEKQAQKR